MSDATRPPFELETISVTAEDAIGTLTLQRPEQLNAMSPQMIEELMRISAWLADRAPFRALIVTGSGRAFSAGGDVTWFRRGIEEPEIDLPSEVRRGADVLHQAIIDFKRIPYPVIAAINGPAAGAGFSLALMCDLRIASEEAGFACAYGRIGASPDGGMTWFLPRVICPARAAELMINDPDIGAAAALEQGLVTKVVPAGELLDEARRKAGKLAAKSPHYIRMVKKLVWESLGNDLATHLQLERHGIADSMATEDLRRAVPDFFAGRKPEFEGR
jgi:2-(1,2-epoxy-1,2-dihydrophenyl)acetyl-CoA isomerase